MPPALTLSHPRRPLHVVMLAQYLPLHFSSTMQRLARKVGRLTLLLSEQMDESRDWVPNHDGLEVRVQRSLRVPVKHRHPLGFQDRGSVLIPYSTIADLRELRPDVVISVEVGPRTLQAALLRSLGAAFKLIVQVRESENTAQSRGLLRRTLRRTLLPRMDHVFVNGMSGRQHVLSCGVAPERISIVPSGTDTAVFGRARHQQHTGNELRLLYVGQLVPRKGLLPFARALVTAAKATTRPISWTLAGRGPEESALRSIVWPRNLHVSFVGAQPYRKLPELYAQADAFMMPSLSDEWGMVVNEAMASGLPVLGCTGAQAVEELVIPFGSGWRFAPKDEHGLAQALSALIATPSPELAAMGARAHARAMEISDEFTATAMMGGMERALAA